MRLTRNVPKKQKSGLTVGQARAEKPRDRTSTISRLVTQRFLKSIKVAEQREAVLHCKLRDMLQKGAHVEPGSCGLTGAVFHCDKCGRFYAEEGRFFQVVDYDWTRREFGETQARADEKRRADNPELPQQDCPYCRAIEILYPGSSVTHFVT